ncbi:hypothetical protein D4R52_03780 [bacterium]|nr:MAG: hypothetical protein D4R52_03780 [bacterium]
MKAQVAALTHESSQKKSAGNGNGKGNWTTVDGKPMVKLPNTSVQPVQVPENLQQFAIKLGPERKGNIVAVRKFDGFGYQVGLVNPKTGGQCIIPVRSLGLDPGFEAHLRKVADTANSLIRR